MTHRLYIRGMILVFALFAVSATANTETYDYPIEDSYEATVIGTPSAYQAVLPKHIPFH